MDSNLITCGKRMVLVLAIDAGAVMEMQTVCLHTKCDKRASRALLSFHPQGSSIMNFFSQDKVLFLICTTRMRSFK